MRYERKYRINGVQFEHVHHAVMNNPATFSKAYPDRYVNSVYYDTQDLRFYHENVQGVSQRVKYRVRWYGKDYHTMMYPIIEKKIKSNMLGAKEYISLEEDEIKLNIHNLHAIQALRKQDLIPVAMVRYQRTYLESFDKTIRATIDKNLRYFPVNAGFSEINAAPDEAIILEIKFDECISDDVDYCLQNIPFRLTKNSKYVTALDYLKP